MRLLLYGSGAMALPSFEALAAEHEIPLVLTQPDRPAGRRRRLTPTDVAAWAESRRLPLLRAPDVNAETVCRRVRSLGAEAAIVIAFGQKLAPPLLDASGAITLNLHASLLPRHRGAAPVHHAILAGDRETGVSVIGLARRMDAGPVYATRTLPIDPRQTAGELHDRLAALGPEVLLRVLEEFRSGHLTGHPQEENHATRAPKLGKADRWIDWREPAEAVQRRLHGLTPWPGVRVLWMRREGEPLALKLHRAQALPDHPHEAAPGTLLDGEAHLACGRGAIRLLEVQPPGKPVMDIAAFLNGHRLAPGERLESEVPVPGA